MKKGHFILNLIIVILAIVFCCGCREKEETERNDLFSFKTNHYMTELRINENNDIIDVSDGKNRHRFYNKMGDAVFDCKAQHENIIIDDVNKVCVCWDNSDSHLYVYDLKNTLRNVLTFTGNVYMVRYLKVSDQSYFLVFVNNNSFYIYNFQSDGHYKFRKRNVSEKVLCVNLSKLPYFYFADEKGSVYKSHISKRVQPTLCFNANQSKPFYNAYPFGESGFALLGENNLLCIDSKGNSIFKIEYKENELCDESSSLSSEKGNYLLAGRETSFEKNGKVLKEKVFSLYDTEYDSEVWTKGSLFMPIECICVTNKGDVYSLENNTIVKYAKDCSIIKTFDFKEKILKAAKGRDYIAVLAGGKVYMIYVKGV